MSPLPFTVDPELPIGGKARALARLAALDLDSGLSIPLWTTLPPDTEFSPEDLARILDGLGPGPFAVRSSAEGEDGVCDSHAGQFESILNVPRNEVAAAITRVRASASGEYLKRYRASRGLESPAPEPAVLIQQMVTARFAGVAFSADPVSGRRDHRVVAAVAGLGEALVSGAEEGERWVLDAEGEVVAGPDSSASATRLPHTAITAIAGLTTRCAALSGSPQDIEWALDASNRLWLLQSRPITTLGSLPDPASPLRIWDNSNLVESYAGVTTPLTFSFARRAYEHVYRHLIALLGVDCRRIAEAEPVLQHMIGLVRGRMYYQLSHWYHLLALLPGYRLNSRFMEQMMGVDEPIPAEIGEKIARVGCRSALGDALALGKTALGIGWQAATLDRHCRRFHECLDRALGETHDDLDTLDIPALLARYRLLEERLLRRWDAPMVNDFLCMIAAGVVRAQCRKAGDESRAAVLLADCGEVISAEPPRLLRELAGAVAAMPGLAATIADQDRPVAERVRALRSHEQPRRLWDAYLERFGDRCLGELKLESPTVADDPGPTLAAIGGLSSQLGIRSRETTPDESASTRSTAGESRSEITAPSLGGIGRNLDDIGRNLGSVGRSLGGLRGWWLRRARRLLRNRENLRFERTRVFGRVRQIFIQLGRRLAAEGRLDRPDDIFYLDLDEILGLDQARTTAPEALATIARARRQQFDAYAAEPDPPTRLDTRGPLHRHQSWPGRPGPESAGGDTPPSSDPDTRTGLGASPGVVCGRARVVRDPRQATIEPGEILVAPQTDPGWIVLFAPAAGLVVERGSLLSHAAIVSRELALPCAVSVADATNWIETGQEIEVDGTTGRVTKLDTSS